MNITKLTICLNCGCSHDVVKNQMNLLSPLRDKYEIYWNNRIDRHPTTYFSFSKLINHSIETSKTEMMIFINDRSRPTCQEIEKILHQMQNGFACSYMYNAGFMGFTKSLIRKIGWWDERHLNGDFSDQEWPIRLKESNLAFYESQETKYDQTWKSPLQNNAVYPNGERHWEKKWTFTDHNVIRNMDDEFYSYSLQSIDEEFDWKWNSWDHSVLGINYCPNSAPSHRLIGKQIVKKNT